MKSASHLVLVLLLPLLVGSPGAARAAKAKAQGPVAVLPFKDLNKDPEQAWMSRGIAETLVSDLKRVSKLTIVERDQLDRAMSEIASQQGGELSTVNAVAVGKLVGARTIVLGSYQRAGPQLRLNARFVQVETGVILDTAKVTGQVKQVFRLQDRLVAQLLDLSQGRRKKVVRRKPPPETDKTIKAYRLYAMAMTTATDAGQAQLLRKAVEMEPGFSYALDELDALEARLKAYEAEAERLMDQQALEYRKVFRDPKTDPVTRWTAATTLQGYLAGNGYHRARLRVSQEIYETNWAATVPFPYPSSRGLADMFHTHYLLKQYDRALSVGEKFLKEFPTTSERGSISGAMTRLIDERRETEALKNSIDAALRKIDVKEAKLDLKICDAHGDQENWAEALETCSHFVKRHTGASDLERELQQARWYQLEALLELGRFDEAQRLATAFIADYPEEGNRRLPPARTRKWPGATLVEREVDLKRKAPGGLRVALLPFKRTSKGRELLRLGLVLPRAISFDLERGGRQAVVDEDLLAKDLKRRPQRGRKITEIADAVEVGKAVGADLVVIASYAVEDERLIQVSARKIDVKKAKVVQEVSVEGTARAVLTLQDALARKLFGKRFVQPDRTPPPPSPTSKRKPDPERAYRFYNSSLTAEDTTRFTHLTLSLEQDPTFAYAQNDYELLVHKAQCGAATSRLPPAKMEQALRERFGHEGPNPAQRRTKMMQFFGLLEKTGHQKEILILAQRIYGMSWPAEYSDAVRANAVYWLQKAHDAFEQHQKVIEMADRFEKEFPKESYAGVVINNGKRRKDLLTKRVEKRERLEQTLARYASDRIDFDLNRCETLKKHHLYLRARRVCQDFVDRHQDTQVPGLLRQVKTASWKVVETHFELGQFQQALALGKAHVERFPDQDIYLTAMSYWPKD